MLFLTSLMVKRKQSKTMFVGLLRLINHVSNNLNFINKDTGDIINHENIESAVNDPNVPEAYLLYFRIIKTNDGDVH